MSSTKRLSVCAALLAGVVQMAGAETIDKSLAVDPRGEVEISNVSGNVVVTGWDRSEVQVNAELGEDVDGLEFRRDGERTIVKVKVRSGRARDSDADLTLHVPRDSRLTIRTVSADQVVEDVRGVQRLSVVSGEIRTQVWNSEFKAESVSGDIVAKAAAGRDPARKGRVRVTSVSGSVLLDGLGDELEVNSVSGDLNIRAPTLARASLETTNGNVKLQSALTRDAQVDVTTINGELAITLDGVIDAEFDIETFNGRIDNCFGPKAKRTHEHGPGNELRFKEGQGAGSVRIKTLNGRVTLCRSQKSARQASEPRLFAALKEIGCRQVVSRGTAPWMPSA